MRPSVCEQQPAACRYCCYSRHQMVGSLLSQTRNALTRLPVTNTNNQKSCQSGTPSVPTKVVPAPGAVASLCFRDLRPAGTGHLRPEDPGPGRGQEGHNRPSTRRTTGSAHHVYGCQYVLYNKPVCKYIYLYTMNTHLSCNVLYFLLSIHYHLSDLYTLGNSLNFG